MVVGGMHGDEANGYTAAGKIKDWSIDAGKLVVLPEANKNAIRSTNRIYNDGTDLNRQFPTGEEPTTSLAREIWDVVVMEDIDFLFDLHSSYGIYNSGDGGVGQGIFSTQAGGATSYRKELVSYLNANYISNSTYDYSGATSSDGSSPMLKHKVGAISTQEPSFTRRPAKTTDRSPSRSEKRPPQYRSSSNGSASSPIRWRMTET